MFRVLLCPAPELANHHSIGYTTTGAGSERVDEILNPFPVWLDFNLAFARKMLVLCPVYEPPLSRRRSLDVAVRRVNFRRERPIAEGFGSRRAG